MRDLRRFWAEHPPLYLVAGALLGTGGQQRNRVIGEAAPNGAPPEETDTTAAQIEQIARAVNLH